MLDRDLAELYGVETKYLNRQVKRNVKRFPDEFMFQLTTTEKGELVTNWHRFNSLKHSTSLPFAFTEHGAVMLASRVEFSESCTSKYLCGAGICAFKRISLNSQRTGSKT